MITKFNVNCNKNGRLLEAEAVKFFVKKCVEDLWKRA